MHPTLPESIFPERSAEATLRGYLNQSFWSVDRWLDLKPDEVLLCEGDEDLDQFLFDTDGRVKAIHEQFKDLSKPISVRSEDVYTSIFNFLVAFYVHHREGRRCSFIFTTSAELRRQNISRGVPKQDSAYLSINVLMRWGERTSNTNDNALVSSIKELVRAYGPKPGVFKGRSITETPGEDGDVRDRKAKDIPSVQELQDALVYLDTEPGRWSDFLSAVVWRVGQESGTALVAKLEQRIANDPRMRGLPYEIMTQRLVLEVLRRSASPKRELRTLTVEVLEGLSRTTDQALRQWAQQVHGAHVSEWLIKLDKRIEDLSAHATRVDERLQKQDERLVGLEKVGDPRHRLREYSAATRRQLVGFERIQFGEQLVSIERRVVGAMVEMAQKQSFVVVGQPGAGKSGALSCMIHRLENAGHDVVCLSADSLPDVGIPIASILESWPGEKTGFLVIDALDAARGETALPKLRGLIEDVIRFRGRWRVVASIRTFDLRFESRVAKLFRGTPHETFRTKDFHATSHVYVGSLTDEELAQLGEISPKLHE
ncbi:MAG TPA: hypothetical protein VEU33_40645, partial [Archangium sp.]|nr:hypothetical protein [Archangium sp.]